jgi:hypothetical protein
MTSRATTTPSATRTAASSPAGLELTFAELKDPMRDLLGRYDIEPRTYPTIGVAVAAYVRDHGVEWHDWEDGGEGNRTPTSAVQRPRAPVITTPPKK